MKPDFIFGVAIALCGIAIMAYAVWPAPPAKLTFQTLAIWQAPDGQTGVVQWLDGTKTKDEVQQAFIGQQFAVIQHGLKLAHVFTVEGRQVDPDWAKSVSR